MKNNVLHKGVFQAFLFNIIIFIILIMLGLNYFYPNVMDIENKKNELTKVQKEYNDLKTKGLNYNDFTKLNSSLGKTLKIDDNVYLSNVLKEFTKDDYNINFINNNGGKYENFIDLKKNEIKIKKEELQESGVSDSIKKIIPYYTDDSSLSNDSLTDFKFINYIEKLLNDFRLEYSNNIGIGNLSIEESVESNSLDKKEKQNQLEGKIYNFKLNLGLVGRKKNIIDFIHYLENVGNIKVNKEGEIEVKKVISYSYYTNNDGLKVKNDFKNISKYFLGQKNIYNNLAVDIEEIKLKDYLDSSNLPTHYSKGETFINYIKKDNNQINEKYNVDLVLKFYVKGLPVYKIKDYIKKTTIKYKKIVGFVSRGIKYGDKNKSKLKYLQRSSLKKLKEYNYYLQSISKEIKDLQNPKKLQKQIGTVYKNAKSYNEVLNKVEKGLDINLSRLSEDLYKNYKNKKLQK